MKKALILFLVLVPPLALLYFGLQRDPRILPSALIGRPAPGFFLKTLEGDEVSLKESTGHPVVLNFWSTWCGPCLAEHRLIREAIRLYEPRGVRFYAVLYEDTPENARQFIGRYGEGAPVLVDPSLRTAIDYGVGGVPETFFIDGEGRVWAKHAGVLDFHILNHSLTPLLEGGGRP